jgi:amidase
VDEVGYETGPLRVGVLIEDVFLNNAVHPECVAAVSKTVSTLEDMGHVVEESYPTALTGRTGLGPALRVVASSNLAAELDSWGERIGRPITQQDVSPRIWEGTELGRSFTAVEVHRAVARLADGVMRAPEWWTSGFDLLVTPTLQQPPPHGRGFGRTMKRRSGGLFTMPFSISGQPAISLPLHWTPDGLPVGVQLVADYGRADLLLRVAASLEEALPWRHCLPPIFA